MYSYTLYTPFYGLSGAVRCVIPYSSLTNLTPQPLFFSRLPLPSPPLSPLLSTSLYKANETEVGPLFTGRARESKGGHTGQERERLWECVCVCVCICAYLSACTCARVSWVCVSVCNWICTLWAPPQGLTHPQRSGVWHEVSLIQCQRLCASLDSEVSLMTRPIHQQPSMLHYISVYAVEPCCLRRVWVFGCFCLSACDTERERDKFCHYRLTAKLCRGCCGNKTLGTSGCVVNEKKYRFVRLFLETIESTTTCVKCSLCHVRTEHQNHLILNPTAQFSDHDVMRQTV